MNATALAGAVTLACGGGPRMEELVACVGLPLGGVLFGLIYFTMCDRVPDDVEETTPSDQCIVCEYDLAGLPDPSRCPECGSARANVHVFRRARWVCQYERVWRVLAALLLPVITAMVLQPKVWSAALAYHYAQFEPWSAALTNAFSNARYGRGPQEAGLSMLISCPLLVVSARWLRGWRYWLAIALVCVLPLAAVLGEARTNIAWSLRSQGDMPDGVCGKMLLLSLLAQALVLVPCLIEHNIRKLLRRPDPGL